MIGNPANSETFERFSAKTEIVSANLLFRSKEAIDFTDAISTNQSSLFLTKGPMILDIETSIIGIVDLTSAFLFLGPLQLFSFPKPF